MSADVDAVPAASPKRPGGTLLNRLQPALLASVASSAVVTILNAAQGVLLFRMLAESGRGIHSTAINFTQTFLFISMLGTYVTLTQWSARSPEKTSPLRNLAFRSGMLTGLLGVLAVSAMVWLWLPADKRYLLPLCMVCTIALPFEHIRFNLLCIEQGAGRISVYNMLRVSQAVMFPCMISVAWVLQWRGPTATAILWALSPLFALAPHLWLAPPTVQEKRRPMDAALPVRDLLNKSRGFGASVLATDLFNRIDQFLAVKLLDFASLGFYASACPIGQLLLVIPNTFGVFAFNAGAKRQGHVAISSVAGTAASVVVFQVVSATVFAAAIPFLISFLYGSGSTGVTPFALALVPGFAVGGVGAVAEGFLRGCGDVAPGIIGRCAGWILLLVFGCVGYYARGPVGLAYGTSLTQTLVGLWLCGCFYRNVVRNNAMHAASGEVSP